MIFTTCELILTSSLHLTVDLQKCDLKGFSTDIIIQSYLLFTFRFRISVDVEGNINVKQSMISHLLPILKLIQRHMKRQLHRNYITHIYINHPLCNIWWHTVVERWASSSFQRKDEAIRGGITQQVLLYLSWRFPAKVLSQSYNLKKNTIQESRLTKHIMTSTFEVIKL